MYSIQFTTYVRSESVLDINAVLSEHFDGIYHFDAWGKLY